MDQVQSSPSSQDSAELTPDQKREWRGFFGGHYGREYKMPFVRPVLAELDRQGELEVIIDVGSGVYPLSYEFHGKKKTILIDIAAPAAQDGNLMYMKFDIDHLADTTRKETREALQKAGDFLEIDRSAECNPEQADLVIFSDILNYVDYQETIRNFLKYLKPGGRIMIFNGQNRGIHRLFSPKGAKDNIELIKFLCAEGLRAEDIVYPREDGDPTGVVFLVFRKPKTVSVER